MKPILDDLNLFGKRIFDVHSLEVTGEPTSDRHVLTRLRGQILANLARDEAVSISDNNLAIALLSVVANDTFDQVIAELRADILSKVDLSAIEAEVDSHTGDYLTRNLASLVDDRMNDKEIKSPFTDQSSVQIDVSDLDQPDVTVYISDGSFLRKVKPAISKNLVSGMLQIDFISPKSGLIIVRSH